MNSRTEAFESGIPRRLYRGQPRRHRAGDPSPDPMGRNFTDCPFAALAYARGTGGVVLVLDLPDADGPVVRESLWSPDGAGPRRFGVVGDYDRWITAQVPAKELRALLRKPGRGKWSNEAKSGFLVREVDQRARTLAEIDRYLRSGDWDPVHAAWPGDLLSRSQRAHEEMTEALVAEVRRRVGRRRPPAGPLPTRESLHARLEPMVAGLFPRAVRARVLDLLEQSVVVVDRDNVEEIIRTRRWPGTAWKVANLYLTSCGVPVLDPEEETFVGFSEGLESFVTPAALEDTGPFDDFIVHETAHTLHDMRRGAAGLPERPGRERLVELEFRERETFAFSCEAWSRILREARRPAARLDLVEKFAADPPYPKHAVDVDKVAGILREAGAKRNGWKRILDRCARKPISPARRRRPGPHHPSAAGVTAG